MRKKVFGNSNMNLGELNGWCLDLAQILQAQHQFLFFKM